MFKKFLNKIGRVFIIASYLLFVIATIGFAIAFLIKLKQYNDLNDLYTTTQSNLNKNSNESKVTIDNLQQSFNDLNNEVTSLKSDNATLKQQLDAQSNNAYAEINGKISGQVVLGDSTISQFQEVCAENVDNHNFRYCLNVSSITQTFSLLVPPAKYQVYAFPLDKSGNVLPNYKANYTEFVKCAVEKTTQQCDPALSKNVIIIDAKAGQKIQNINPIDWTQV